MANNSSRAVKSATFIARCGLCSDNGYDCDHPTQSCPRGTSGAGNNEGCITDKPLVKPTDKGEINQDEVSAENTIITIDKTCDVGTVRDHFSEPNIESASTTEKTHTFETILDRWVPIKQMSVSTGEDFKKGKLIGQIVLPQSLFVNDACTPNVLPFRQFIYGKYIIELLFKVNANKFQCGKLVTSVLPVSQNLWADETDFYGMHTAIQRNHSIIDFASKTDSKLSVEWIFNKSFVRAFSGTTDFRGSLAGEYSRVLIHVLSPLVTGSGNSTSVGITVLGRIKEHKFAGMSFARDVPQTQMLSSVKTGVTTFRKAVECTENFLDNLDNVINMDKPTDLFSKVVVVPAPRLSLAHGKGAADCVPMRLDPSCLTSYKADHSRTLQSSSLKAIMRTWSYHDSFKWSDTHTAGKILHWLPMTPDNMFQGRDGDSKSTTLEYVCSFFQFWRGTIEVRLDFVSTMLHSGSIQISAEFGRRSKDDATDMCGSASTYIKTFDLGEQRSVTFTIPYIYDTVWRRTQTVPVFSCEQFNALETKVRSGVIMFAGGRVNIRVLNMLRCMSTAVTSEIEVLVFIRAGPSFTVSGLIANNTPATDYLVKEKEIKDFPGDEAYWKLKLQKSNEVKNETPKTQSNVPYPDVNDMPLPVRDAYRELKQLNMSLACRQIQPTDSFYGFYKNAYVLVDGTTAYNAFNVKGDKLGRDDLIVLAKGLGLQPVPLQQMMAGDEVDDDTKDFQSGQLARTVQTTENQMDIIDILRRPILILSNIEVISSIPTIDGNPPNVWMIPLMPPTFNIITNEDTKDGFAAGTAFSPQVAIMNMFRMWRGSLRYTFIFRGWDINTTIYIVALPHSGCRMMGDCPWALQKVYSSSAGKQEFTPKNWHPASLGLPVELVVPSINPTCHVEVPYATELNWTLLHGGSAGPNDLKQPSREIGETNSGHLMVYTTSKVKMDVFWAAGDDFRLSTFLGTPSVMRVDAWCYDDNRAGAQALWETAKGYVPSFQTTVKILHRPLAIAAAAAVSPSLVAPTMTYFAGQTLDNLNSGISDVRKLATTVNKSVDSLTPAVGTTLSAATDFCSTFTDMGSEVSDVVHNVVSTILAPFSGKFYSDMFKTISGILMEFFRAWLNFSPTNVAISLISVLTQLGLITTQWMGRLIQPFTKLAQYLLFAPVQVQDGTDDEEEIISTSVLANACGLCVAAVGAMFAVDVSFMSNPLLYLGGLFKQMFKPVTWSVLTHASRFFKDTIEFFRRIIYKVAGYKDVRTEAILQLTSKSPYLKKFARDASAFLMEANTSAMVRLPGQKLKFWMTLMNAHQIMQKLIFYPKERVSMILIHLCKEVIKKGNELHVQMSNCPVRYEPFVISVSGSPGIGKSFLQDELLISLLQSIGFTELTSEVKYVKGASPKFWNGYKDQPVIIFDDFLNIRTPPFGEEQVSDLYNLKSSAIFNPNMARLEEKEIRANPLIVILLTNDPFPQLDFITEKKAVLRRRDYMIDVSIKKDVNMVDVRKRGAVHPNFDHLEFRKYTDVVDPNSLSDTTLDFTEFMSDVTSSFQMYHQQEKKFVLRRLERIQSLLPQHAQRYGSIEDPFSLFYKTITEVDNDPSLHAESAMLPSEMIELKAAELANYISIESDVAQQQAGVPLMHATNDLLKTWKRKLEDNISRAVSDLHAVPGNCSVCSDSLDVVAVCSYSTIDNQHAVCLSCYMGITRVEGTLRCPVCRNEDMEVSKNPSSIGKAIMRCLKVLPSVVGISALEVAQLVASCTMRVLENACSINPWTVLGWTAAAMIGVPINTSFFLGTCVAWRFSNNIMSVMLADGGVGQQLRASGYFVDNVDTFVDALEETGSMFSGIRPQLSVTATYISIHSHDVPLDFVVQECNHRSLDPELATLVKDGEEFYFEQLNENYCSQRVTLKRCVNCEWTLEQHRDWLERWCNFNRDYILNALSLRNQQDPRLFLPLFMIPEDHAVLISTSDMVRQVDEELDRIDKSSWWELLSTKTCSFLKTILPYIKYVIVGLGVIAGLKKTYDWLFGRSPQEEEQMGAGGYTTTSSTRVPAARTVRFISRASTQSNTDHAVNAILRNLGHFAVIRDGLEEAWLAWTGIVGSYALINKHSFEYLRSKAETSECEIILRFSQYPLKKYIIDFKNLKYEDLGVTDVVAIKMPGYIPLFKDIRKLFITEDKLYSQKLSAYGLMVEPPQFREYEAPTVRPIDFKRYLAEKIVSGITGEFALEDIVEYNYSRKGACGGVVLSEMQETPILGLHCAGVGVGTNGVGFAVLITQEKLMNLEALVQADVPGLSVDVGEVYFDDSLLMQRVGTVDKNLMVYIPNKTNIIPSLLQNYLEPPKTEPTILSSKDPRFNKEWKGPLIAGIEKAGKLVKPLNLTTLDIVKEFMKDYFVQFAPTILSRKTLSYEEAILGLPGIDYFDSMPMNTSAGWPWVCKRKVKNKRALIELFEQSDGKLAVKNIDDSLLQTLHQNEIYRRNNVLAPIVTCDLLKDERKKKEKVRREGSTRVFSASPIDATIAMRQHFLHFAASLMHNRFKSSLAIGVSRDGPEWGLLYNYLSEVGTNAVCIDYKNFGPGFSIEVFLVVIEIVVHWHQFYGFSDEHCQQLKIILMENAYSYHIARDCVYKVTCGSPSGSAGTAIINSLVNFGYILMAWVEITQLPLYLFVEHVRIVTYGDDLIMTVSDKFIDKFNTLTLQQYFESKNIFISSSDKSFVETPFIELDNADFLKSRFKKHPKRPKQFLAPMDWTSIEECAKWIHKSDDIREASYVNAETSLRLAYGHGEQKFNSWKTILNKALVEAGVRTIKLSWKDCDKMFFDDLLLEYMCDDYSYSQKRAIYVVPYV